MVDRPTPPNPDANANATELFAEYLEARESGDAPDVDALCARAGPAAAELRDRIRALGLLDDLAATLRDAGDDEDRDGPPRARVNVARLGRYQDLRLLGEGGLSRVYVARDPDLERDVALKVIASEHVSLESARGWILQEGRTIARLEHPGIVQVFDLGEMEGLAFVAMELVDGPSLADVLDELRARRRGAAPTTDDARVLRAADRLKGIGARTALALEIARALAACHAGGVLHRDIKPGNVLLAAGGEPKLIDFGLAHLEEAEGSLNRVTQRLIGTPAYIAPEQVESGQTGKDPRSDQFSFGVLLYELLTLSAPFQRSTRTETLDAVTRALPALPRKVDAAIPSDLETICLHALERLPGERYPSMDALADDLEAFLEHRAIAISAPGLGRRLRLWARRNRRDILMFAVPAAALVIALVGFQFLSASRDHAALEAEIATARGALGSLDAPFQIQAAYGMAQTFQARAHELDTSSSWSAVFPPLGLTAREYLHGVSDRLAACLARGLTDHAALEPFMRPGAENDLFRDWGAALALDAALCPECTANATDRERGRIHLPDPPEGTRLVVSRMRPSSPTLLHEFEPFETRRVLGVGEFRISWLDAASQTLAEFDLHVEHRSPGATLVLVPIPDPVRARFVHVPAGEVRVDPRAPPIQVPEFWAHAGWFTAADVLDLAGGTARPADGSLEFRHGVATLEMTPGQAQDAARRLSARLPSVAEAIRILDVVQAGGSPFEPLPERASGEFCSGRIGPTGRPHLRHAPKSTVKFGITTVIDTGIPSPPNFAFRLVTSHPPSP